MPRFRILYLTTVPETLDFLGGHVEHLKSKGVEVHAVSSPGRKLFEFAEKRQVEVHSLPMSRRITPLGDLLSLWRLRRIMGRLRPDIVHGHTPKGGLLAMIGACLCGVPVRIYHIHGLVQTTAQGPRWFLLHWSEKISCTLANQVYCVSDSLRQVVVAQGLCAPKKIKVLLKGSIAGVDAAGAFNPCRGDPTAQPGVRQEHGIAEDALVLGFVGRIVPDKGVQELAQAWKILRQDYANLHLLVVGPFEAHDPVSAEVETLLRGDGRIHLLGNVRPEDMPRIYQAFDLLVLPTYREGFGTVLLEGAAMGLAVVATRIPGCVDAVRDGETGILVPPHDAGALAVAIRRYLDNPEMRRRHGLAGRRRSLRDFRPDDLNQALYQEYLRLPRFFAEKVHVRPSLRRNKTVHPSVCGGKERFMKDHSTFYRRRGKRLLDAVASAAAIVVLASLLLLLAILVRFFLGAPILFRQTRSGKGKKPFTILKFRTMTTGRDALGNLLPDSERLTRFGRLLRHTSLDELPEFFNVLRGDMSLVGPRPLLPRYDSSYSEREARRFDVLPGITGWAQINGRNDLPWDDRLECDAWYVESYSFFLDLKILALTVIKVLRRDNVQTDPALTFGNLDEERRQRSATISKQSNHPPVASAGARAGAPVSFANGLARARK